MCAVEYALGYHCGITFAGIKAASLFWLKEEDSSNINYYKRCFARKKFYFMTVKSAHGKTLYYVFNMDKLKGILSDRENCEFLHSLGYKDMNIGQALNKLKARFASNDGFPHEVGLFLGYPLDDVKGFILDAKGGETLGGMWKVYSRPDEKAKLFARYRGCTKSICHKISSGTPIEQLFKVM